MLEAHFPTKEIEAGVTPLARVARVAAAWRRRVDGPARRAMIALCFATLLAGAHLARVGTTPTRSAAGSLLLLTVTMIGVRAWRERRDWRDASRTVSRVLIPTDRKLGERALRALKLVDRTKLDTTAGSADLADLHLERLIARASLESVERGAATRARGYAWLLLALIAAGGAALAIGPMRVFEGIDVLVAWKGRAPVPMTWLEYVSLSAQPPGYLRSSDRQLSAASTNAEPMGSVLTVRGVPRFEGRHQVLTDGKHEVPFVSDGSGGLVARWPLEQSASLRIAARFGKVLIEEPEALDVRAVPDRAPVVVLEGAPKTLRLAEIESLELEYAATDDHGIKQIDLVLRAGGREQRRALGRFDGESRHERGAHVMSAREPFLRRTFLPIEVTIEAKDNDPQAGEPKWGKSAAIIVLPPAVGEPEALRYEALADGRDAVADVLGAQLVNKLNAYEGELTRQRGAKRAAEIMSRALAGSHGGLRVPAGLRSFLNGQMRVLAHIPRQGASLTRQSEDVLLAVDVALRALASRDARGVAQRLADVADEAADAAKRARESEAAALALSRFDAALGALDRGAGQLAKLGMLGRDVGSVARADIGRIRRARDADQLSQSEAAARHLAARLRRATPSFAAEQSGGVESGMGSGAPGGEPSQADDRFDQLAGELEQLVQEHGDEIQNVERALGDAEQPELVEGLREEARRRAEAIRRAVEELPQLGAPPGSARSSAALGREHAGAMAQNLERLALEEAVQSGRDALSSLAEAERKAKTSRGLGDWLDDAAMREAKQRLQEELAWAEQKLDTVKRAAEAKARGALEKSAERESGFARRAANLSGRGSEGESALPKDALEALERAEIIMREAAGELGAGKGEKGVLLQREAQRLLERASTGQTSDAEEGNGEQPQSGPHEGGRAMRTEGEVPEDSKRDGAEEFRRRVLEGLAKDPGGRLAPAVRRYAEGLLR